MRATKSRSFRCPTRPDGFTLIELAIALFIVALLLAGLLGPLSTRIEQSTRNEATRALEQIREALYGYALVNRRLPCPDTDTPPDGLENRTGALLVCSGIASGFAVGTLPFGDLGLSQYDPWGNDYAYGVTASFADDNWGAGMAGGIAPCSGTPRVSVSFELCSEGNATVQVKDSPGDTAPRNVTEVPAIVISYGSNGGPNVPIAELDPDEAENRDGDPIAVSMPFSDSGNAVFDDMLVWIAPNILMNRMINAERLP